MTIPIEEIADNLLDNRCVLMLGPDLVLDGAGQPLHLGLLQHLQDKGLDVTTDIDGLYKLDERTRLRAFSAIKRYYNESSTPTPLHNELARIPWHLVVSISPDLLMQSALAGNRIRHQFGFYVKQSPPREVEPPCQENPLLYNLFGTAREEASLVLTHGDLLDFIFSVIKEHELPKNLRHALDQSSHFLFLGFNFNTWYLRILFHLFYLSQGKPALAAEGPAGTDEVIREFYRDNFGVQFVDEGMTEYVHGLYEEFRRRGALREPQASAGPSLRDDVLGLVKAGRLEDAMDRLEDHFDEQGEDEQLSTMTNIHGGYSRLKRKIAGGTISEEDGDVELRRIGESVLAVLESVEPPEHLE